MASLLIVPGVDVELRAAVAMHYAEATSAVPGHLMSFFSWR